MAKLMLIPEQAGYSATDGSEVISTRLEGGASRRRQDVIGATAIVVVVFVLTAAEYDYLKAFYRLYKAASFTIDLILDASAVAEYTAQFVPGSLTLKEQQGLTYVVGVELEVEPHPQDVAADSLIIMMNDGTYDEAILDALASLVNDWPLV